MTTTTYLRVLLALLVLAALLVFARPVRAEEDGVPLRIQAALLKKILLYDEGVPGAGNIAVLHDAGTATAAAELAEELGALGLSAKAVRVEALPGALEGFHVVYVLAASPPASLRELCARRHILSVSDQLPLAERGDVAVAVGRRNARSEIVVHLERSRADGHVLSPDLLRLARLVR